MDLRVPCRASTRRPLFAHCRDPCGFWVQLAEKALAKKSGSYAALWSFHRASLLLSLLSAPLLVPRRARAGAKLVLKQSGQRGQHGGGAFRPHGLSGAGLQPRGLPAQRAQRRRARGRAGAPCSRGRERARRGRRLLEHARQPAGSERLVACARFAAGAAGAAKGGAAGASPPVGKGRFASDFTTNHAYALLDARAFRRSVAHDPPPPTSRAPLRSAALSAGRCGRTGRRCGLCWSATRGAARAAGPARSAPARPPGTSSGARPSRALRGPRYAAQWLQGCGAAKLRRGRQGGGTGRGGRRRAATGRSGCRGATFAAFFNRLHVCFAAAPPAPVALAKVPRSSPLLSSPRRRPRLGGPCPHTGRAGPQLELSCSGGCSSFASFWTNPAWVLSAGPPLPKLLATLSNSPAAAPGPLLL